MSRIDGIEVTRLKSDEYPSLLPLLEQGYAGRETKLSPERWRWQYLENPRQQGPELCTWVARIGGAIVGQRPTMPTVLKIGDEYYDAHWASDFLVHPDYQGSGVGSRLMESVHREADIFLTLDSSPASRRIYAKLGFAWMGFVPRLVRVCDPGRLALKAGLLGRMAGRMAGAALVRAWDWRSGRRAAVASARGVEVERAESFGAWADELWERVRGHYRVMTKRDATFLNWRYTASRDFCRILVVRRGPLSTGYLVYRIVEGGGRGFLSDLLGAPDDGASLDLLIARALEELRAEGVAAVETFALHPALRRRLRAHGFVRSGPGVTFIVGTRLGGEARALLLGRKNWFITGADGDVGPVFR
ncbi:MAG: GNAT family N-acetyltransferase [Gemmatimonadetes bacterium]|nr:GNAT family N-acetyltransferase [Gemmatimonadota bacterium]